MFYACGLHVLCVVPISVIHPIVGSIMLVEIITVVKWNVHLAERFYVVTKLILVIQLLISMQCRRKTFLCILTIDSTHPIGHHVP
jgi:hypothetical protein